MARDIKPAFRLPLILLGFFSLVLGICTGLVRIGWTIPLPSAGLIAVHGPLMVSGFFGTVISLERAVALGRRWAYIAPLLTGLGGAALAFDPATVTAAGLMSAGSIILLAASLYVAARQRALFTITLALGAACLTMGNLLWLVGLPIRHAAAWWVGFLVLTIAGERLELSRFLPPSRGALGLFGLILASMLLGLAVLTVDARLSQILALALLALTAWLLRYDIARRTVLQRGLTRYIAVCLLSGYAWLAVGGTILLLGGGFDSGNLAYDAGLHALFLGFVFSMVFGHAPIVVPSVTRLSMHYHPLLYVPLFLLHTSVLLRLVGDTAAGETLRSSAGVLNAAALVLFIVATIVAVLSSASGFTAQVKATTDRPAG